LNLKLETWNLKPTDSMVTGTVFDIQRFCTHDGPGIRTVVFLKGCPLDCAWCHNPESKRPHAELFYNPQLCIGCGNCVSACPLGAHEVVNGVHEFDRAKCRLSLRCADTCYSGALEAVGRELSVEEVMAEVAKDRIFYEESGGGLTLSGGEPMAQFGFTRALLRSAKSAGIHTCMETCGFGPARRFREVVGLVDLFLWDIKDTDSERHRANTGAPLERILENLRLMDAAGGKTILRCPLIPEANLREEHLDAIAALYRSLANCAGIELLPYHPFGGSKHTKLGVSEAGASFTEPTEDQMSAAREYLLDRWGIDAGGDLGSCQGP